MHHRKENNLTKRSRYWKIETEFFVVRHLVAAISKLTVVKISQSLYGTYDASYSIVAAIKINLLDNRSTVLQTIQWLCGSNGVRTVLLASKAAEAIERSPGGETSLAIRMI